MLTAFPSSADELRFQDGKSPTSSYQGTRAVTISTNPLEPWRSDTNYGTTDLWAGGIPIKQSALMRWDVSTIPSTATITAVTITVRALGSDNWQFPIYQCLRPWTESQATWQLFASGSSWAGAGATAVGMDRGATALGQLQGSDGTTTTSLNAAGVAVVQSWVNGTTVNNGFVVQDYSRRYAIRWPHAGAAIASQRPRLQVSYSDGSGFMATFQNGVSPTVAYAGNTDTTIAEGTDPVSTNRNQTGLRLAGAPQSAAILLSFDVSAIPTDATVSAARLELEATQGGSDAYPIFALLRPRRSA